MDRDSMHGDPATDPGPSKPDAIIDRDAAWNRLTATAADPGSRHHHLHGPRGTGKTLLARHAIDTLPDTRLACYVSCIQNDTQYKVLKHLYEAVTNGEIASGYHTSQLQDRLADRLVSRPTVIVLDEVDFLLVNDGSDLLYYLTRIADDALSVITVSANHPDLSTVVDERTYSSLQPQRVAVDPYTEQEAGQILRYWARDALDRINLSEAAISTITARTTDIRLGLHWLAAALTRADTDLTAAMVTDAWSDAVDRYRNTLLSDFTRHHHAVLDAIKQLSTHWEAVHSGHIYDRYTILCREGEYEPLSTRRVSDFLTHLELLSLIDVDHYHGGRHGKTRKIRLRHPD